MYWFRRLFRKAETERRLDSELRFHLEQRTAENMAAGMTPAGRCISVHLGPLAKRRAAA